MAVQELSLDGLLHPVTVDQWLADYWEKDCLWITREDPDYFRYLIDWQDLEEILLLHRSDPRDILQLVPPPDSGVKREHRKLSTIGAGEVYKSLQQGHTIVFNFMQSLRPRLAELARRIKEQVDCTVNMNLYLTPKGEQGFPVHIDRHDVFILQVTGEKEWYVYEASTELPMEFDRVSPSLRTGGGALDENELKLKHRKVLKAGDLLFMPRGFPHKAVATPTAASMHITVSLHQYYGMELAKTAIELLATENAALRRALLPGFRTGKGLGAVGDGLKDALAGADWTALLERSAEIYAQKLVREEAFPADGHIAQVLEMPELTTETVVERRRAVICRVHEQGGKALIEFGDSQMVGPLGLRPAYEMIRDRREPFAIGELPGAMSDSSRVVLARRLVKDGLLRVLG